MLVFVSEHKFGGVGLVEVLGRMVGDDGWGCWGREGLDSGVGLGVGGVDRLGAGGGGFGEG